MKNIASAFLVRAAAFVALDVALTGAIWLLPESVTGDALGAGLTYFAVLATAAFVWAVLDGIHMRITHLAVTWLGVGLVYGVVSPFVTGLIWWSETGGLAGIGQDIADQMSFNLLLVSGVAIIGGSLMAVLGRLGSSPPHPRPHGEQA